ncbi:MAG TPA: trypsin-like peptidase domain-containing protein [Candidatus Saccharimonadales bacterium]|nr:trypsin-like peptidase domain-containing protein [Candidatus Saccharimonadales bacterium]
MLDKMPEDQKKLAFWGGGLLVLLVALVLGILIGVSYPNWYSSLPFKDSLPAFLKPVAVSGSVTTKSGEKIVRTVEESAVIDVVDKTSPSVVSIVAKTTSFDPSRGTVSDQQGIGTGFVVDGSGIIITNNHVVCDNSVDYAVVTKDGKTYDAKKISLDPANDIGIIKIDAKVPALELGDSDPAVLKAGQKVIAIGNALGQFQNSVTVGVVSGLGRGITAGGTGCSNQQGQETLQNVIQTDAALNPGNSGGPLLDLAGRVVGVNFAISSSAQNIGFVIPINRVKVILDQYKKEGRIIKPYLGVVYQTIDSAIAKVQNVPEGAFVRRVVAGSPADKAGIEAGDIVTKINDQALNDTNDLVSILNSIKVGQKITIEVYRDGKTQKLTATVGEAPE